MFQWCFNYKQKSNEWERVVREEREKGRKEITATRAQRQNGSEAPWRSWGVIGVPANRSQALGVPGSEKN